MPPAGSEFRRTRVENFGQKTFPDSPSFYRAISILQVAAAAALKGEREGMRVCTCQERERETENGCVCVCVNKKIVKGVMDEFEVGEIVNFTLYTLF